MSFLYGALGMVLVLAVFAVGVAVGWKFKIKADDKTVEVQQQAIGEKERQQMMEDQQAFRIMLSYNVDMAYGIDEDRIPDASPDNQSEV